MTRPAPSPARRASRLPAAPLWLRDVPLAHRGLHGVELAENSLPAFEAARDAGFGVELDVHLAADGVPVVVHDADLVRVAGDARRVASLTSDELARIALRPHGNCGGTGREAPADAAGSPGGVPTLDAVLAALRSVPVMIEIKQSSMRVGALEAAVAAAVAGHDGPVCIASFNPLSVHWFARHQPMTVRAVAASPESYGPAFVQRLLRDVPLTGWHRPHAISYDVKALPTERTAAWRAAGGTVVTWTVRSPEQLVTARAHADNLIFEGLRP
jgi:glycerophosphoryl diester phosphodiesterase